MKKKYLICNYGCDDDTKFEMELTDEERDFLIRVFEENNKIADYQCKPSLYITDDYIVEKEYYDINSFINKGHSDLVKGE